MISGQRARVGRLFTTSMLATIAAAGVVATTAWAAGNTISIKTPSDAKTSPTTCGKSQIGCRYFSVGLSGHAITTETLYMFLDRHTCGANPAVEHRRADAQVWTVHGSYHVSQKWYSEKGGTAHVCAYLQKASEPENAAGGVLAHKFARFTIHA